MSSNVAAISPELTIVITFIFGAPPSHAVASCRTRGIVTGAIGNREAVMMPAGMISAGNGTVPGQVSNGPTRAGTGRVPPGKKTAATLAAHLMHMQRKTPPGIMTPQPGTVEAEAVLMVHMRQKKKPRTVLEAVDGHPAT